MVFDDDNAHRRKSSLVDADHLSPSIKQRSEQSDNTACFVHHLLERERKTRNAKGSNLQEINEDTLGDKRDGPDHGPATHSRLLTKKQLSEMAWGVRELSKRLGSVRLKLKVKNVFLLTKAHDESLIGYTKEVVDWLLSKDRQVPYTVYVYYRCRGQGVG